MYDSEIECLYGGFYLMVVVRVVNNLLNFNLNYHTDYVDNVSLSDFACAIKV